MRAISGTTIRFDDQEAQRILDALKAIPGAAVNASIRAANKTMTRVRRQVLRHLATRNQLPQKVFKGRVFLRRANRKMAKVEAGVWIGTRPIDASRLGEMRKTRTGYRAGKRYFPSAFEATMPSGFAGVFMRAPQGYAPKRSRGSKGWTDGRPRTSSRNLPIVKPYIEIDLGGQVILDNMQSDYLKTLAQEANFEMQKALGKINR